MNQFMQVAIEEARKGINAQHGGPFGAVVVKDGKIIGRGHNHVIERKDPTCHGEIEAIRDACKNLSSLDLSGCDVYTTSEPCLMCLGATMWSNVKHIYYGCSTQDAREVGFRDELFYHVLGLPIDEPLKGKMTQIGRDECFEVFKEYIQQDKTLY